MFGSGVTQNERTRFLVLLEPPSTERLSHGKGFPIAASTAQGSCGVKSVGFFESVTLQPRLA